ncbi:fumarylacetoacetate hydrolase domain-containing protein 2 isoform X2 [Eurytemora carolleeae]|nr:fumarylacetoacetate hydrolase domain-containing protein 2 isoform X2 [Eurytemora carolleeae]|eukprot:XP_023330456.1 fumarylacetoacetate hydrolase domain-containing protein 2-like isoform X2 [Eurytemora affinis]
MQKIIEGGQELLDETTVKIRLAELNGTLETVSLSNVQLVAPITKPNKILGIGLNYKDGADEMGKPYPEAPIVFIKLPSTISGPTDPLPLPNESKEVDWEVELVVIIGKKGRYIKKEDALDYVFGYTVGVDYTARDLIQKNSGLWTLAKNFPGFCSLGPAVVTKDEIPLPLALKLSTEVNGKLKQSSNTSNMIFDIRDLISYLSIYYDLLPGDLILSGTPAGVGVTRSPPEFIKRGDIIKCEIQKIGSIVNTAIMTMPQS